MTGGDWCYSPEDQHRQSAEYSCLIGDASLELHRTMIRFGSWKGEIESIIWENVDSFVSTLWRHCEARNMSTCPWSSDWFVENSIIPEECKLALHQSSSSENTKTVEGPTTSSIISIALLYWLASTRSPPSWVAKSVLRTWTAIDCSEFLIL